MGPLGTGDWGLGLGLDNKKVSESSPLLIQPEIMTRWTATTTTWGSTAKSWRRFSTTHKRRDRIEKYFSGFNIITFNGG